ncbi:MAG: hypothetical protein U5K76_04140 [Woeseiaceae bacterium]|nr:hypothetical protein [Woeseiaceae bacterium]
MNVNQARIFRLFKYTVYALLTLNIFLFFAEEWAASAHRFRDGIEFADIIEGYAATIDTAAWVILLLMFELETYVLDDRQFTRPVTWTLHGLRAACYCVIVYAFWGYVSKLLFLQLATPVASITDLCAIVADRWVYAIDFDEYAAITAANCATLADGARFIKFAGLDALVDVAGYREIVRLAWVDVINSGVWLGVVALLEVDVQLQSRDRLHGLVLKVSNAAKYVLYSILFLAAVYWGVKGDFVDFWDAFLWLVAFVFIEMNVIEWQHEDEQAARTTGAEA